MKFFSAMPSTNIKQHDSSDCGAACLASVCAYYGLGVPLSRVRMFAGTDLVGTNVLGLLEAAKKLGMDAKGVKGDKKSLFRVPKPTIAHVVLDDGFHHYVVVYNSRRKFIRIMDPAIGKQRKLSWIEFEKMWSGVLVLVIPSESFIARNENISLFNRFWTLVKPHKSTFVQVLFSSLLYTVLGFSTSVFIEKITDHVLVSRDLDLLHLLGLIMLFILFLQVILGVCKDLFIIRVGQEIDARMVLGFHNHMLRFPQRFFDTIKVGEIISRIGDALKIRMFLGQTSMSIFVNLFILIFSYALLISYHWKLGLILMTLLPIYVIVYSIADRLNRRSEKEVMEHAAQLEGHLVESLQGIRTIKLFGVEEQVDLKTEIRFISLLKKSYRSSINQLFLSVSLFTLQNILSTVLLWIGSVYVIDQSMSAGELLSCFAIVSYLTGPLSALVSSNRSIQSAFIAARRLFEIEEMNAGASEIESPKHKKQMTLDDLGDIRFSDVEFRYNNSVKVLSGFSARIEAGQITAIVGESGSGKSTLLYLLQNIYQLSKGQIYIGRTDLRYYDTNSLRESICVVPQQIELFSGTVAENIALGERIPDMAKIQSIIQLLEMSSLIDQLEQGLYTFIGENGSGLSLGQRQRIAIARALYRSPDILLLDEPSSALDSLAEKALHLAIHSIKNRKKTVIMVSHRWSTLAVADKILVLHNGKLAEEGSHEELMKNRSVYFKLRSRANQA